MGTNSSISTSPCNINIYIHVGYCLLQEAQLSFDGSCFSSSRKADGATGLNANDLFMWQGVVACML